MLDSKPKATPRVGRNDPCPCGSGKRYKQCCGALRDAGGTSTFATETPEALLGAAMQQHHAGRLDVARSLYEKILKLAPGHPIATQYLGVLAMQEGHPDLGEAMIRQALLSCPEIPDFHNNLGLCLRLQGRLAEAIACYRQSIALNPAYVEAYNNLGLDLQASGDVQAAIESFETAVRLLPEFAEAHWNLGLALLLAGDFKRGWMEYEWRLRCHAFSADGLILSHLPRWQGESLSGKRIFVRREQGAGDTLQFLRFLPLLVKAGAHVLLDVPTELSELSQTLPCAIELVEGKGVAADYATSLMSLPYSLQISSEVFAVTIPYLRADPQRVAYWRSRLTDFSGLRVGVVWAGNPQHVNDRNRSCPLTVLLPLFQISGIDWFSLQKGDPAREPGLSGAEKVIALGQDLNSYADTAALLSTLDLLISVDTSVVHLAGALGCPAWLMLPFAPDWRWQQEGETSLWYPSLRLFRQSVPGDWAGVIARLALALQERCGLSAS